MYIYIEKIRYKEKGTRNYTKRMLKKNNVLKSILICHYAINNLYFNFLGYSFIIIYGEFMSRKRKTSFKKKPKDLTFITWIVTFIIIAFSSFGIGYYVGYDDAKNDLFKKESKIAKKSVKQIKESETIEKSTKEAKEKYEDASHEVESSIEPKPIEREKTVETSAKAKLAIIIDDVSVKSHIKAIKSLNLPITMSFLPPSEFRPNSHKLAAKEEFYMVHLPMEAKNFTKEEPYTLKVDDSQIKILQRVAEIKKLFPKVKYINNHTGSKFTSDEAAVNRLIYALEKENINFIDSRTIGSTKVPKVMKSYGKKYMSRDIFLDHELDKDYVKGQIKKAIKIAKVHGSAIAIGHPHANTLLAISESKHLFSEVELVLIDKLY
jgi:hypothetical protein